MAEAPFETPDCGWCNAEDCVECNPPGQEWVRVRRRDINDLRRMGTRLKQLADDIERQQRTTQVTQYVLAAMLVLLGLAEVLGV